MIILVAYLSSFVPHQNTLGYNSNWPHVLICDVRSPSSNQLKKPCLLKWFPKYPLQMSIQTHSVSCFGIANYNGIGSLMPKSMTILRNWLNKTGRYPPLRPIWPQARYISFRYRYDVSRWKKAWWYGKHCGDDSAGRRGLSEICWMLLDFSLYR